MTIVKAVVVMRCGAIFIHIGGGTVITHLYLATDNTIQIYRSISHFRIKPNCNVQINCMVYMYIRADIVLNY